MQNALPINMLSGYNEIKKLKNTLKNFFGKTNISIWFICGYMLYIIYIYIYIYIYIDREIDR